MEQEYISTFKPDPENILSEAMVIDNSKYNSSIGNILSSEKSNATIFSEFDLIKVIRDGLSTEVVKNIASLLNITIERLAGLLHISPRTIQRKAKSERLNAPTSEHLVNIAEVIQVGLDVLGSQQNFNTWSNQEIKSLDFQKPIDLLDTAHGCKMVSDVLNRIAHGVYS